LRHEIDGCYVSDVQIADLNGDSNPELYVFLNSVDNCSHSSLVAYSSNNGKSVSEIYLPDLDLTKHEGYRNHDVMYIQDGRLIREYPVFRGGEVDSSAETAVIKYKLIAGEASWKLVEEED
jgi:hypothetical protein